jgi:hypothetical protein
MKSPKSFDLGASVAVNHKNNISVIARSISIKRVRSSDVILHTLHNPEWGSLEEWFVFQGIR